MSLALGLSLLLLTPQVRDTTYIGDRAACARCVVSATRIGTFGGGSRDSISPAAGAPHVVTAARGGGLLVMEQQTANRLAFLYDGRGHLTRTIGRGGMGPGELALPLALATNVTRDTVYIFDERPRQMTVFSLDGRVVRSVALPVPPHDALILHDARMVIASNPSSRSTAGMTLHLVTQDGRLDKSFHPAVGLPAGSLFGPMPYLMALNPAGGFVVFDLRYLTITLYDAQGNVQKVLRRNAAWDNARRLPLDTVRTKGSLERPYVISLRPPSLLRSIHMDAQGRIWILAALESPTWQAGGKPYRRGALNPSALETFWVGHVEVIDPVKGTLIHAQGLRLVPSRFVTDDLLVRAVEDNDGSLQFEAFRVRLVQAQ